MTTQSAFTNEEWSALSEAPGTVALAIAKAADSGFFGGLKELKAVVSILRRAESSHAGNELITTLLDQFESNPKMDADDPEEIAHAAVASCEVANTALQHATDSEADEYRRWILDIATEVAEAAKEDGVRISPNEAALIERIRAALS